LQYLKAWQLAYSGNYAAAIPELNAVLEQADDVTLRFRAGVTAVNTLAISSHYEDAYRRLNQLLEWLPQISDQKTIAAGLGVSALLYNQAGQYDLGLKYAERLMADGADPASACKGIHFRLEALYRSGRLRSVGEEFQKGIERCTSAHEVLWANLIRTFVANLHIDQGHPEEAVKLLRENSDDALRTHYPPLIAQFDAIAARAYLKLGDLDLAREHAKSALDHEIKNEITKSRTDAYEVLYEVAKQQGDLETALAYHEKYAAADKGYLNDTSARTLAFQMVNQQVLDKKRQIDALNEKNERLQLRQQVDVKTAETARLYILLLIVVLASIAFWAYKTKRSQLRFMRLARRDGLTGIFNRQHFLDAAGDQLRYCAKSARDACVVVIDLDHFKSVNDVYGHATGDLVLKRAVKTCEDHLRSIDIFGRLGGEEFGIVLPDCPIEQALACAEQLRKAITDVSGSDARIDFPVSASFGIAATHTSGYDLRELLANADSALYEAKREGRNRIASYQSSATVKSVEAAARAASTH
jgi:diguanylate cyclase (GGDEF)-like protein